MKDVTRLSRRAVLSVAAGSVGAVTLGASAAEIATGRVDYNRRVLQENGDVDLILDWAEYYNGDQLESQEIATSHESGNPIITLENVLPGDSGRVSFGMQTAEETSAQLQMLLREVSESENGITEPEEFAGDTSPDSGELPEYTEITAWYDTGVDLAGNTIYGACDGEFADLGEEIRLEGSLAGVVSDGWRPIDADPDSDDSCLGPDEGLCFTIEWALPEDLPGTDDNIIQGDSVSFEIGFRGMTC